MNKEKYISIYIYYVYISLHFCFFFCCCVFFFFILRVYILYMFFVYLIKLNDDEGAKRFRRRNEFTFGFLCASSFFVRCWFLQNTQIHTIFFIFFIIKSFFLINFSFFMILIYTILFQFFLKINYYILLYHTIYVCNFFLSLFSTYLV